MALNIPMPESPGSSLLQGLDTGSNMMSRIMQPILERERLKQQQEQFVQNYAIRKQAESRANALMPYMIQHYQDTHRTAASEADMKDIYRNLLKDALNNPQGAGGSPAIAPPIPPQMGGGQPNAAQAGLSPQIGNPSAAANNPMMPGVQTSAPVATAPPMPMSANADADDVQEHELRSGNPRLARVDSVAGLVPGIPKPVQHINNGMVFTTYPSGRMTVQKVGGNAGQTPGERNVSAKEASKIRDQATALVNSANLVQQGYDIMDSHPDLTGPGTGLANKFNLINSKDVGKFNTVTGKLQAELGKYASSRGGIQAVNWAASVKPGIWKPEDTNYGMFEAIQQNLQNDYNTLNEQYKAATGKDLSLPLPQMKSTRGTKGSTGTGKVKKVWKFVNGELV